MFECITQHKRTEQIQKVSNSSESQLLHSSGSNDFCTVLLHCNSYETFLNWFPYLLICTPFQPSLILQKCMTYIYWCYHPCYHPEICMTYIHTHIYIYIFINTYCIYIGLKTSVINPQLQGFRASQCLEA